MDHKVLKDFARIHWMEIAGYLKRSTGLSVSELAAKLKMSYMGVKQHCVDLQKMGYIDTWRRPKKVGRPEKVCRLTAKAKGLFPQAGMDLTLGILKSVERLYGDTAPEKLLFAFFQTRGENYKSKVKGNSVIERAESFAKLRTKEGYICDCKYDAEHGLRLMEYHNPYKDLLDEYSFARRMEDGIISNLLQAEVTSEEKKASGLYELTFFIKTL